MSEKREIHVLVSRIVIALALVAFLAIGFWSNLTIGGEQQFSSLAQSFLHGRVDFLEPPGGSWDDTTPYAGRYCWPLGPAPAGLLMPFELVGSWIGTTFYQRYLQGVLVLLVLALVFRTARRIGYDATDAAYAAFGFCFASAFLGVAFWPWSWYFAHVITCVALFMAVLEMA